MSIRQYSQRCSARVMTNRRNASLTYRFMIAEVYGRGFWPSASHALTTCSDPARPFPLVKVLWSSPGKSDQKRVAWLLPRGETPGLSWTGGRDEVNHFVISFQCTHSWVLQRLDYRKLSLPQRVHFITQLHTPLPGTQGERHPTREPPGYGTSALVSRSVRSFSTISATDMAPRSVPPRTRSAAACAAASRSPTTSI